MNVCLTEFCSQLEIPYLWVQIPLIKRLYFASKSTLSFPLSPSLFHRFFSYFFCVSGLAPKFYSFLKQLLGPFSCTVLPPSLSFSLFILQPEKTVLKLSIFLLSLSLFLILTNFQSVCAGLFFVSLSLAVSLAVTHENIVNSVFCGIPFVFW